MDSRSPDIVSKEMKLESDSIGWDGEPAENRGDCCPGRGPHWPEQNQIRATGAMLSFVGIPWGTVAADGLERLARRPRGVLPPCHDGQVLSQKALRAGKCCSKGVVTR